MDNYPFVVIALALKTTPVDRDSTFGTDLRFVITSTEFFDRIRSPNLRRSHPCYMLYVLKFTFLEHFLNNPDYLIGKKDFEIHIDLDVATNGILLKLCYISFKKLFDPNSNWFRELYHYSVDSKFWNTPYVWSIYLSVMSLSLENVFTFLN